MWNFYYSDEKYPFGEKSELLTEYGANLLITPLKFPVIRKSMERLHPNAGARLIYVTDKGTDLFDWGAISNIDRMNKAVLFQSHQKCLIVRGSVHDLMAGNVRRNMNRWNDLGGHSIFLPNEIDLRLEISGWHNHPPESARDGLRYIADALPVSRESSEYLIEFLGVSLLEHLSDHGSFDNMPKEYTGGFDDEVVTWFRDWIGLEDGQRIRIERRA